MKDKPQSNEFYTELGQVLAAYVYNSTKTCIRCCHFDEQAEHCLKFKQRPPARIIVLGCGEFEEEIPF